MRSRAIREGSVGLLILIAVGLFGGLVLWLRGLSPGARTYRAVFLFENTLGMNQGAAVRYRGVPVGRVLSISPAANEVEVVAEITQADLRIPQDANVVVNQSGLIGETTIDITPVRPLPEDAIAMPITGDGCDSQVIVCSGDRVQGFVGASYESLIRSAEGLASAFADPDMLEDLRVTLQNATVLTESATLLTDELIGLSQQIRTDLGPLMVSANQATGSVSDAAAQVGSTAAQFEVTGTEINNLIMANRGTLISTLGNLNRSTAELEAIMATLSPTIRDSELLNNLDTLSADAAATMADLRSITSAVNTPENLLLLQQTLDSARSVFQSAQKVLADVDELTGDPVLRQNIRRLINGLSDLVSITHQLEQESQLAEALTFPAGNRVERITLTPAPKPEAADTGSQLLVSHEGQLYRFQAYPSPVPPSPVP